MNSSRFNEWVQTVAAVGVIVGLLLVTYEIRVSNRIGIDQAYAESLSRYSEVSALFSTVDAADLFVRAQEGEELSRKEMARLDHLLNAEINALFYDWTLVAGGTLSIGSEFKDFYGPAIQWYLGSDIGRRKWEIDRKDWDAAFADAIDSALAATSKRNVLGELDYLRGAEDSVR